MLHGCIVMNIHNTMAGCNEDSSDEEEEEHAIARPKVLHTLPFLYDASALSSHQSVV